MEERRPGAVLEPRVQKPRVLPPTLPVDDCPRGPPPSGLLEDIFVRATVSILLLFPSLLLCLLPCPCLPGAAFLKRAVTKEEEQRQRNSDTPAFASGLASRGPGLRPHTGPSHPPPARQAEPRPVPSDRQSVRASERSATAPRHTRGRNDRSDSALSQPACGADREVVRSLWSCGDTGAGEAVESRCGQDRYPGQGVAKSRPEWSQSAPNTLWRHLGDVNGPSLKAERMSQELSPLFLVS